MDMIALLFLAAGIPAMGAEILRRGGWTSPAAFTTAAVALLVGLASTMAALYVPLAATGRVIFWPTYVLLAAGLSAWSIHAARQARALDRVRVPVAAAVVAVAVAAAVHVAWSAPFSGYDAKAIYGLKAKALLYERDLRGPLFNDVDVVHYHADYPLGLPLLMALAGHAVEGEPTDAAGALAAESAGDWVRRHDAVSAYVPLAALWLLGYIGLLAGWARRHVSGSAGLLVLTALALPTALLSPWVVNASVSWAGADLPLALCLGVVALGLVDLRRGASRAGWLLVPSVAAAVMLKNDAIIGLVTLAVAFALMTPGPVRWRGLGLLGAGLVAGVLPCHVAGRGLVGAPYDESYFTALLQGRPELWLQRAPDLLIAGWNSLTAWGMTPFWGAVALLAVPMAWRRGGAARMLAMALVLHLAATTAIFLITPNLVTWHVVTALPRLWIHMGVAAGWLLMDAVAQVWAPSVRIATTPPDRASMEPA